MKSKLSITVICCVISALFCACHDSGRYDTRAIREAVTMQMESYPESTLQDLYKNFFQDAFGPGHLLDDTDDARSGAEEYLRADCMAALSDSDYSCIMPDYEPIGWHHRFYRVNLSVINDTRVPFDLFMDAFMQSAQQFTLPALDDWQREWSAIEAEIRDMGYEIDGFDEDSEAIHSLLNSGQYTMHHSRRYNECYHPHYRLIEKTVFEERLLPLLQ